MQLKFIILAVALFFLVFTGCELMTDRDQAPPPPVGNELIINEVFSIMPDKYYAYSWIEIYNPTNREISWSNFDFPANGWVAGGGGTVLRTTETGVTWDKYHSVLVPKFNGIDYYNEDTLFAVSEQGKIFRSNDKGQTWFTIYTDASSVTLNKISVIDAFNGTNNKVIWACGDDGTILLSINRGNSFTKKDISAITTGSVRDVYGISVTEVAACGVDVILRSNNIGIAWLKQDVPLHGIYNSIRFASPSEGRCVGTNGNIVFTNTSGSLWIAETSTVNADLNSVFYFRSGHAWAVGNNGTIVSTTENRATKWSRQNSGTTANLNYVEFVDTARGFAVGDGGIILYTDNGGFTWKRQQSGTTEDLTSASFLPFLFGVENIYVVQAWGERQHVFADQSVFPPIINRDFITKVDTGDLYFQANDDISIEPGGFVVITSDKNKFENHTYTGPSDPIMLHNDIAAVFSSTNLDSINAQARAGRFTFTRWNLLTSSEVRLLKVYAKFSLRPPFGFLGFDVKTLEVIRIGDYSITTDYPNNKPAPAMPEWWSLARYKNLVTTDLNTFSTDKYFYLTKSPIPGWVSQLAKP